MPKGKAIGTQLLDHFLVGQTKKLVCLCQKSLMNNNLPISHRDEDARHHHHSPDNGDHDNWNAMVKCYDVDYKENAGKSQSPKDKSSYLHTTSWFNLDDVSGKKEKNHISQIF